MWLSKFQEFGFVGRRIVVMESYCSVEASLETPVEQFDGSCRGIAPRLVPE